MKLLCTFAIVLLACFNASAQTGWQWGIRNSSPSSLMAYESYATAIDRSGNLFVASYVISGSGPLHFGSLTIPIHNDAEMVVTKTDPSGNVLWVQSTPYSQGAPLNLATDSSGNLYMLGYYWTNKLIIGTDTAFNPSNLIMYFTTKLSPSGNVDWVKNITGSPGNYRPTGDIGVDDAQNIYVTGTFATPGITIGASTLINNSLADSDDVFLAKFDTSFTPIWATSFGSSANEWPTAMAVSGKGTICIAGRYFSDTVHIGSSTLTGSASFIADFDSTGHPVWAKDIDRHITINDMTADLVPNIYVAGNIDSQAIVGTDTLAFRGSAYYLPYGDAFVARFNSAGHPAWARSAGGDSSDVAWKITLDSCNNVWVCGSMGCTQTPGYSMTFDSLTITGPTATFIEPAFIAAYNSSGTIITAMPTDFGGDEWVGMEVDRNGNLYFAGDYFGTEVFGPDTISFTGPEQLFVAKYTYSPGGCSLCPIPSASFSFTGSPDVNFSYTGVSAGLDSVIWNFGDGTAGSGTNPVHTYSAIGTYTTCVTAYNSCGSNTACNMVAITPTALQNNHAREITIYPNPATDLLTIARAHKGSELRILNMPGQQMIHTTIKSEREIIDIRSLPAGSYIIEITNEYGFRLVKKLVKN